MKSRPMWKVLPVFCLLLLQACGSEQQPDKGEKEDTAMATVQVEAFYRERMLLRPGAQLRVTLSDVSKMDVAAELITEVAVDDPGAPPYSVTLHYDPAVIDSRFRYAVRATISADNKLLFTTTEHVDAFAADDQGVVKVRMHRVAVPQAEPIADVDPGKHELADTEWQLTALLNEAPEPGAGGKPLSLEFSGEQQRYHGFSGCNTYSGSWTSEGKQGLTLGQGASTRKACIEGMAQEHTYLTLLPQVSSYRRDGETLSLLNAEGAEIASFTALAKP